MSSSSYNSLRCVSMDGSGERYCSLPAVWKHYPVKAVPGHFNYHCAKHGDFLKGYSDTVKFTGRFERIGFGEVA